MFPIHIWNFNILFSGYQINSYVEKYVPSYMNANSNFSFIEIWISIEFIYCIVRFMDTYTMIFLMCDCYI